MTNSARALQHFRIVMSNTSHPGNIGAAARAMKTMGIRQLVLIQPKFFPAHEATAMAANADDILAQAVVCDSLDEALKGCALSIGLSARRRQISHELVDVREAAKRAVQIANNPNPEAQQVALVFGNEMSGLSNRELDLCQLLAMIPTDPDSSSLNVAAAVQVMCYELRMALLGATLPSVASTPLASNEDLEGFFQHLEQTLLQIGFLNPEAPKKLMSRLRRLYARAGLEKDEINLLRGILKLTQDPNSKY
jgi:tRNA/rRNA methyltransferase